MDSSAAYFPEKARQCRRLAAGITDERTIEGLRTLAAEFEARAKAAEAEARSVELLGNGKPGTLVQPDDGSEPPEP